MRPGGGKLKAAKRDDLTDVEGVTMFKIAHTYSARVGTAAERVEHADPEKLAGAIGIPPRRSRIARKASDSDANGISRPFYDIGAAKRFRLEVLVADNKKLLTMIELQKLVKDMTEQEIQALARHVVGQVRAQIPMPPPK